LTTELARIDADNLSPSRVSSFLAKPRWSPLYEVSSYYLSCSLENQFSVPTKANPCTAWRQSFISTQRAKTLLRSLRKGAGAWFFIPFTIIPFSP